MPIDDDLSRTKDDLVFTVVVSSIHYTTSSSFMSANVVICPVSCTYLTSHVKRDRFSVKTEVFLVKLYQS
jgi:hypothetical protein